MPREPASADLYAEAGRVERQAAFTEHSTWYPAGEAPSQEDLRDLHVGCLRCHLEAKVRLYLRAGACAEALEGPREARVR